MTFPAWQSPFKSIADLADYPQPKPVQLSIMRFSTLLATFVSILPTLLFAEEPSTDAPHAAAPVTASEVMQAARLGRCVWRDFPGFTADVAISTNEKTQVAKIRVDDEFEYEVSLSESDVPSWASSKMRSILGHRKPGETVTPAVAFVDSDNGDHTSGRMVARKDGSGVFRIKDGVIREVLRRSDDRWLEISTLAIKKTDAGTYLPEVTSVTYRNPKTGHIESNRSNHFSWVPVGDFQLPSETLTVEVGQKGERETRRLVFTNHMLTEPENKIAGVDMDRAAIHRPLPESLTSFGAAVVGEYLYVFSGHSGEAHGFGRDQLVNHFRRIKFDDPEAYWEELAMHEPAQSTALVTDGKYIYRVGGLSFLNSGEEEETNFNSTDYFARYDIEKDEWTELAPLPVPRSSIDAAVVGRSVFVAGGWNLQGASSGDAPWHEDILRFDLDNPEAGWKSIEGPGYIARAISVAAHDEKLYMIGGIQQHGITRKVSVFDPKTETWEEGPELKPDSMMSGFATSSFAVGGRLYVTGSSGVVYRLSKDGSDWEVADRLMFPRMFLRLVPAGEDRLIALGGTGSGGAGRMAVVESLQVGSDAKGAGKMITWSVPFGGEAKHSQSLVVHGAKLYAFGGNSSRNPHNFAESAFVDEAFVFDVTKRSVESLPDMPKALQSSAAVVASQTSEHKTIVLAGGLGFGDKKYGSSDLIYQFDPDAKVWSEASVSLPRPRAMFDAEIYDDAVWMFGGSDAGDGQGLDTEVLHWWADDSPVGTLPDVQIPVLRRSHAGVVVGDEYFMIGGIGNGMDVAKSMDVFHMIDRTWRTAAEPPVARVFPSACAIDKKIFVFGGFAMSAGHFGQVASLQMYDTETDTWSTLFEDLPGTDASMRIMNFNDRILFYAVDREEDGVANFALYDPQPTAEPPVVEGFSFARRSGGGDAERNAKLMMRKDVDKSGQLSMDELGKRMAAFAKSADSNGDNLISYAEVKAALEAQEAEAEEESSEDSESE
ncbi:MAG: DUF3386 family protein [Planctomycetota bacterium]